MFSKKVPGVFSPSRGREQRDAFSFIFKNQESSQSCPRLNSEGAAGEVRPERLGRQEASGNRSHSNITHWAGPVEREKVQEDQSLKQGECYVQTTPSVLQDDMPVSEESLMEGLEGFSAVCPDPSASCSVSPGSLTALFLRSGQEVISVSRLIDALSSGQIPPAELHTLVEQVAHGEKGMMIWAGDEEGCGCQRGGEQEPLLGIGLLPEKVEKVGQESGIAEKMRRVLLNKEVTPGEIQSLGGTKELELVSDESQPSFPMGDVPGENERGRAGKDNLPGRLGKEQLLDLNENREIVAPLEGTGGNRMGVLKTLLLRVGVEPQVITKWEELTGALGKGSGVEGSIERAGAVHGNLPAGELNNYLARGEAVVIKEIGTARSKANSDLCRCDYGEGIAPAAGELKGGGGQVALEQVARKPGFQEITAERIVEQIVKAARVQVIDGQTKATLLLEPPELGRLHMHIVTKENQVRVNFFAETPQVKEIIENHLPQLRHNFFEHGLEVEHFQVFVGYHPGGDHRDQAAEISSIPIRRGGRGSHGGEDTERVSGPSRMILANHRVDLFI